MENGKLEKIRGYYVTDFINYLVVERNLAKRTVKEYERDIRLREPIAAAITIPGWMSPYTPKGSRSPWSPS